MSNKQTKKVALEEEKVYIGETETEGLVNDDENNLTKYKDEVDDYYQKKKTKKRVITIAILLALFVIGIGTYKFLNRNYALNEGSGEVSGQFFSLKDNDKFVLDGVTYTLPVTAKDFIDNGWTIIFDKEEDETDIIEEYQSAYVYFQKDGKEFEAILESFNDKEVPIDEADVHNIYVDANRTPDFKGPLDISVGDSTSSVIEKLENGNYAYEYDYYKTSYSDSYSFSLADDYMENDYFYSYYINCYDDKVNNLSIYYNEYNYD